MAVTAEQFLERWPHFSKAPAAAVTAAIAAAAVRVNADVFGDKTDEAVQQLAAHLLCIDPGGQFARMVSQEGKTTYGREWEAMRGEVLYGDRVI
jgi:hypothetical protein